MANERKTHQTLIVSVRERYEQIVFSFVYIVYIFFFGLHCLQGKNTAEFPKKKTQTREHYLNWRTVRYYVSSYIVSFFILFFGCRRQRRAFNLAPATTQLCVHFHHMRISFYHIWTRFSWSQWSWVSSFKVISIGFGHQRVQTTWFVAKNYASHTISVCFPSISSVRMCVLLYFCNLFVCDVWYFKITLKRYDSSLALSIFFSFFSKPCDHSLKIPRRALSFEIYKQIVKLSVIGITQTANGTFDWPLCGKWFSLNILHAKSINRISMWTFQFETLFDTNLIVEFIQSKRKKNSSKSCLDLFRIFSQLCFHFL